LQFSLLFNVFVVLIIAYIHPTLANDYLAPKITASWIAVIIIFLCSGLKMKTSALKGAAKEVVFHFYVQFYNFGIISLILYLWSRFLKSMGYNEALADGFVILGSLPMTVNMIIV